MRQTLQSLRITRPTPTPESAQGMCLDKGYDYEAVRLLLEEFGFTAHLRAHGEEAKAIRAEAGLKRVVRWWSTHSWLNRFRRLLVR